MKILKLLFLIYFLTTSTFYLSAQSLIDNGNFETGNRSPGGCDPENHLFNIDSWEIALTKPATCEFSPTATPKCETPDWADMALCGSTPFYTVNRVPPPSTPSNARFIGMAYKPSVNNYTEAIRTKLKSPLAKNNVLRIKLKMANSKLASIPGNPNKLVKLKILFTKFGEHWNSDVGTTANVKWEIDVPNFIIYAGDDHLWYTKELSIPIPHEINGGFISDVENMVILPTGDDDSYVFIDDVEVYQQDPCTSFCTPNEARDPIEFKLLTNPAEPWRTLNPNSGNITLSTIFQMQSSTTKPFTLHVKNATDIKVIMTASDGGIYNVQNVRNINVLGINETDQIYQMFWWGTYLDHVAVPQGQYTMELVLSNCSTTVNNTVTAVLIVLDGGAPPGQAIPEEDWVAGFDGCCPHHEVYNNINFTNQVKTSVESYIHAGTSGSTVVESTADVSFVAFDEIKLGSFFEVKQGANFKAKIAPCGFTSKNGKVKQVINYPELQNKGLNLYPNPVANNSFTIEYENEPEMKYNLIKIRNIFGTIVYEQKISDEKHLVKLPISLDYNLAKGLYFIEISNGKNNILKSKLILQ